MAARMEAERQRIENMFQYMQTLGAAMGQPPPSSPATTPVSMNVLVCMFLLHIGHTTKKL
jgi:hypothetical protein